MKSEKEESRNTDVAKSGNVIKQLAVSPIYSLSKYIYPNAKDGAAIKPDEVSNKLENPESSGVVENINKMPGDNSAESGASFGHDVGIPWK
jgi:hypothetical protein